MTLHEKLNPAKLGYSPKMAAIIGYIIGHEYGTQVAITGLSVTSDGFLIASTAPTLSNGGAFLGYAGDLEANITRLLNDAKLTDEELEAFNVAYRARVHDYRRG